MASAHKPTCYVCGSPEIAPDADLRSPTCTECRPARNHVVSMQTGAGGAPLAVCPCGWRYQSRFGGRMGSIFRDVAVRTHWRAAIAASVVQAVS